MRNKLGVLSVAALAILVTEQLADAQRFQDEEDSMARQAYFDDVEDNGDNEDDEQIDEISDPYETNDD